jgi:hypothetical protein
MRGHRRRASFLIVLAVLLGFAGTPSTGAQEGYIVPNGTFVIGTLNDKIEADETRAGQIFTVTVTNPNRWRGATLFGRVYTAKRSGRLAGKSEMALIIDRIQLPDGQSYRFTGNIQAVRTPDGDEFGVMGGETVEGNSQTERTVTRTAIGAIAGTIVGAILDGGSGAAAGAAIGGSAGAVSVLVQGRRSLKLKAGTRMTIRSSAHP